MRFKSECRQPRERLPETKVTILRRIRQRETKNIYDGARTFASGNDRAGKQILRCAQNDKGKYSEGQGGGTRKDKGKYSEGQKRTTMNDNGEGL